MRMRRRGTSGVWLALSVLALVIATVTQGANVYRLLAYRRLPDPVLDTTDLTVHLPGRMVNGEWVFDSIGLGDCHFPWIERVAFEKRCRWLPGKRFILENDVCQWCSGTSLHEYCCDVVVSNVAPSTPPEISLEQFPCGCPNEAHD